MHPALDGSRERSGFALMMVLILIGVGLAMLAGVLAWSSMVAKNSQRYNAYLRGMGVTDGMLEKSVGTMIRDYQKNDQSYVSNRLDVYRGLVPTASENPIFSSFRFTDLTGATNRVSIAVLTNWSFGPIASKFTGMQGYGVTYQITACATDLGSPEHLPVTVQQQVQLASIPVFDFGLFYNIDFEVCPGSAFTVSGRVHCNANIYTVPSGTLTFPNHVTATGKINRNASPNDPTVRTIGTIVFKGDNEDGLAALTLPMGTNNSPNVLHTLVELAPAGESTNSLLGRQRYFNKAELVIRLTNNTVIATSGAYNGFSISVTNLQSQNIVQTNAFFYSKREADFTQPTDIDLNLLNGQYNNLTTLLGRAVKTIYIIDSRPMPSQTHPGIRLINAKTLPAAGLTVATPHPIFVKGNYNVPDALAGTTNTTQSAPASLVGDAITILSQGWNDGNSMLAISSRTASANTTVNAGIIAGIVPSGNGWYSGGVENFFRMLENWGSRTLTFNGSIFVPFDSREAIGPWGTSSDVYTTPGTRNFTWDSKFQTTNLPPSTPFVTAAFRSKWTTLQSTNAF